MRSGARAWGGRLFLALASSCVAIALGEVIVRWRVPPDRMIRFEYFEGMIGLGGNAPFLDLVETDPDRFWRLRPNVTLPSDELPFFGVISNGQGFREDHDVSPAKRPGEIRILFLGDSVTFGFKLAHSETFPEQVEALLEKRFPEVPVECINAGVPGYTLFQGWRLFETVGLAYDPDLVVLNFGQNDQGRWPDGVTDLAAHDVRVARQPPAALRGLRLSHLLWKTLKTVSLPGPDAAAGVVPKQRVPTEDLTNILHRLAVTTERERIGLLLFISPYRAQTSSSYPILPHQDAQYEFAKTTPLGGVDGVSLVRALAEKHDPSALFVDAGHPSALTNRHVAQEIVERIEPWLAARIAERARARR